jgi:ascorbate-specific PTS system EIIC-type component UlaA
MPQWIVLMMLAIVGWLVLSIGGGLVVGRLIRMATRRRRVA